MITKTLYAYTVNYLRQEKRLRDHGDEATWGRLGAPRIALRKGMRLALAAAS
jgi:hypothetical protein